MMADQSATPFGTPWESMRGSWTTDYNNSLTLIRAPIDHVVDALADHTERWENRRVRPGRRTCVLLTSDRGSGHRLQVGDSRAAIAQRTLIVAKQYAFLVAFSTMGHHVGIGYVRLARASTAKISTLLLAALLIASAGIQGHAATVNIVVFGASNVAGRGVSPSAAFPAQLEGMLRAKGYDARVVNAGINRDTSAGMLSRLNSAVPDGTQIAIVQTPTRNDQLRGAQGTTENMGAITSQLR